ncbi:MAG TPA: dipeptidase [Gemmatimonadales bacterium]|nr:dipeptidase [Gemmatimonadales bacterium]
MRPFTLLALLALAAAPLEAQTDSALIRHALRLQRAVPMIDGHNDLPWKLRTRGSDSFDSSDLGRVVFSWDSMDIARPQPQLATDIPRLRAGGVGGVFWSTWVPVEMIPADAAKIELEQIDIVRRMPERYPKVFALARTADDILRIHRQGKIAILIGMEGGHVIENSLPLLRMYYDLGARYMTLTHFATLAWADAAGDDSTHRGLTPFGRAVVGEMNRLGMLVDLAHVSDSVMAQALRISRAPIIFSHSSARALDPGVPRDVPDEILRMVPANGGVVMVNFYCPFVDSVTAAYERERGQVAAAARKSGADSLGVAAALRQWDQAHPVPPRPTIAEVADHIDHIRRVAGIDHVGYGSDFEGMDCAPQGLEDVSDFPKLTAELIRRGYSDRDVEKVIGLNVIRVLRQAEAVARRLQREEPPATATIYTLDSLPNR